MTHHTLLSRRTLFQAAAVGGASALATPARAETPAKAKERSFLCDDGFRNAARDGMPGFAVKVRLMSYRSLPLSCIGGIQLKVDGEAMDPRRMILTIDQHSHPLSELPRLSKVSWFILDAGELFIPRATPLAPGEHDVEGTLITVEPYMTAGRFSFYSVSKKRLTIEEAVR